MKELEEKFASIKRREAPFQLAPKPRKHEKITWLEPELVAEIKFAEWTEENLLRQASFKGLRTDKDPRDIKRETADDESQTPSSVRETERPANANNIVIAGIKITNPDKVIFTEAEITKSRRQ